MGDRDRSSRMVVLGRITGVFGVRGWIRVFSHTEPRQNILEYSPWILRVGDGWQERKLLTGRVHGNGIVAQISGCDDRDSAMALMDTEIAVHREQLPPPSEGEFYWTDLQGLRVVTLGGVELGRISHLFATGSNDVIVVAGDRERLIPFLRGGAVRSIDLTAGVMTVDWDPDF